jgi:hypothetical protein
VKTQLAAMLMASTGGMLLVFAAAARSFCAATGLVPATPRLRRFRELFTLERILAVDILLVALGLAGWAAAIQ